MQGNSQRISPINATLNIGMVLEKTERHYGKRVTKVITFTILKNTLKKIVISIVITIFLWYNEV